MWCVTISFADGFSESDGNNQALRPHTNVFLSYFECVYILICTQYTIS
jgi:hypothetical protein